MFVNHIHLFVRDLERAVAFYRNVLGLRVEMIPAANMASVRASEQLSVDLDHRPDTPDGEKPVILGFLVKSADETFAALKAKGVRLEKEPQDQFWGVRNFYFRDPDGYTIECAQPLARPANS